MFQKTGKTLFVILFLAFGQRSLAQQVITFESKNSKTGNKNSRYKRAKDVGKNSLTVGLISPINGYLPFYYERSLLSFLSVQAGAGITFRSFGNDFGQIVWNDGKNSEFVENTTNNYVTDVDDQYYHYKYRKASLGSYFSIAPKIYFSEDCMGGFYLSPLLEWKTYRYKAQLANITKTTTDASGSTNTWSYDPDDRGIPHVGNTVSEHMSCLDICLTIGGHYQHSNHMVVGWSIGAGLRKLNASRLDIYTLNDGTGAQYFRNNTRDFSAMKPLFSVNMVIGGWF